MSGIVARLGRAGLVVLAGALVSSLASCGGGAAPATGPAPVIVDADMSSDDIMALCYLLERPDLSVQAITVEGTGVAHGPADAERPAPAARAGHPPHDSGRYGRPDPLAGTQAFPPALRNGADGMYNLNLPPGRDPSPPSRPSPGAAGRWTRPRAVRRAFDGLRLVGGRDLAAAVSFLARQPGVQAGKIAVLGESMGGEQAPAGSDPRIRAVVAEGATGQQYADHGWRPDDITGIIDRGMEWVQGLLGMPGWESG